MDLRLAKSNLQKMIDLIQKNGSQVILLAVPRFSLFLSPAQFYSELSDENKIPLLNETIGDILKNPAKKSDRVHPNAAGYREIAIKIKSLLVSNGALRQLSNSTQDDI